MRPRVGLRAVDVRHGPLSSVPEVLEHLGDTQLVAEVHHVENALACRPRDDRPVGREGFGAGLGGLPEAEVGRREHPELVDGAVVELLADPVLLEQGLVIHRVAVAVLQVRLVTPGLVLQAGEEAGIVIGEPVLLHGVVVDFQPLAERVADQAVAGLGHPGRVVPGQSIGVLPVPHLPEPLPALTLQDGVEDEQEVASGETRGRVGRRGPALIHSRRDLPEPATDAETDQDNQAGLLEERHLLFPFVDVMGHSKRSASVQRPVRLSETGRSR